MERPTVASTSEFGPFNPVPPCQAITVQVAMDPARCGVEEPKQIDFCVIPNILLFAPKANIFLQTQFELSSDKKRRRTLARTSPWNYGEIVPAICNAHGGANDPGSRRRRKILEQMRVIGVSLDPLDGADAARYPDARSRIAAVTSGSVTIAVNHNDLKGAVPGDMLAWTPDPCGIHFIGTPANFRTVRIERADSQRPCDARFPFPQTELQFRVMFAKMRDVSELAGFMNIIDSPSTTHHPLSYESLARDTVRLRRHVGEFQIAAFLWSVLVHMQDAVTDTVAQCSTFIDNESCMREPWRVLSGVTQHTDRSWPGLLGATDALTKWTKPVVVRGELPKYLPDSHQALIDTVLSWNVGPPNNISRAVLLTLAVFAGYGAPTAPIDDAVVSKALEKLVDNTRDYDAGEFEMELRRVNPGISGQYSGTNVFAKLLERCEVRNEARVLLCLHLQD
jgi:hypothetical protein